MSQFNSYIQQVNNIAQASFEKLQKAETAFKTAEAKYNNNRRPARGAWHADAATIAKVARIEADYHEAKEAYNKLSRSLPDQTRAEVAKIRIELEKAVTDFYSADPKAIDSNVMELLRSGILKPAEYDRLFESANQANNATMCRLIAQAAETAAASAKDDEATRQLRYVANRGRQVTGKPYMDAFDSMADALDRCLLRPYLIKAWDEMTANIRENF
jgi:hypothetical protein